jgi:hypothetical protein
MAKQKVAREITVLVRYTVKATGNIVLYVENDKGDRYYVTLQSNGNAACNCKATRKCYHIARCQAIEVARAESPEQKEAREWETYRAALAKKLAQQFLTTQCVEQIAEQQNVETPPIAMELPVELRGYRKAAISTDTSVLNGAQQSAGVLMNLPSRKAKAS